MTTTLIQPTFTLDLRTIPPRERHPLIFGRFDALVPADGVAPLVGVVVDQGARQQDNGDAHDSTACPWALQKIAASTCANR